MERAGRDQQTHRQEHQRQAHHLHFLNGAGESLVDGLEGRLKLEAEQHLRAENQHARLVQGVFDLILERGHAWSDWQRLCRTLHT